MTPLRPRRNPLAMPGRSMPGSPLGLYAPAQAPAPIAPAAPVVAPQAPIVNPRPEPQGVDPVRAFVERKATAAPASEPATSADSGVGLGIAAGLSGFGRLMQGKEFDSGFWGGVTERRRAGMRDDEARADRAEAKAEKADAKAREAALMDPASKESRRAQGLARRFLETAGYSPEDIAGFSAKDLESFDPIKIAQFDQTMRARSSRAPRALSTDPASPESIAAVEKAVQLGADPSMVQGLSEEDVTKTWRGAIQQRIGQESGHDNIIQRMRYGDQLTRGRMEKGQQITQENQAYGSDLQVGREIGKETRESEKEIARARSPIAGVRVLNEEGYTELARDPVVKRKLIDGAAAYSTLTANLDKMEQLRAKYGVELFKGAARGEYEAAQTLAIGAITGLAASGVLNGSEFERYKSMIPGMDVGFEDAAMVGGVDVKLQQLRGARRAITDAVQANLRPLFVEFETPAQEALRLAEEEAMEKQAPKRAKPKPRPAPKPAAAAPVPSVIDDAALEGF